MKANVGSIDRTVRIVLGLVVLAWLFVGEVDMRWLGALGLVPLATGLAGVCPLYRLFDFDTCPLSRDDA